MFAQQEDFSPISAEIDLRATGFRPTARGECKANCHLIPIYIPDLFNSKLSQVAKVLHSCRAISTRPHLLIIYKTTHTDALSYVNGRALCRDYKSMVTLPQLNLQLNNYMVPVYAPGTCVATCFIIEFVAGTMTL
jgi:hypothetical protein